MTRGLVYTVTCAHTTGYMFHAAIRCVMSGADVRMWRTYIDIDIDKGIHIHIRINTHTHIRWVSSPQCLG